MLLAHYSAPERAYCRTTTIVLFLSSLLILGSCGGSSEDQPGNKPGLTSLTVVPELTYSANVDVGKQTKMVARAQYSDNTNVDVTAAAEWTSSNSDVASVNKNVVTGVSTGTAQIRATFEGVTGERAVTVERGIVSLEIQPAGPFNISTTPQQQLHAMATYTDGTVAEVSGGDVFWSVNPKGVLAFDLLVPDGTAYFLAPGTTTVTVTYQGATGALSVEVLP